MTVATIYRVSGWKNWKILFAKERQVHEMVKESIQRKHTTRERVAERLAKGPYFIETGQFK